MGIDHRVRFAILLGHCLAFHGPLRIFDSQSNTQPRKVVSLVLHCFLVLLIC